MNYTVEPGDWLSKIGPRYGVTWQQLYADNETVIGDNPNLIYPGQVLVVRPGTGRRRATGSPGVTVHAAAQPSGTRLASSTSAQTRAAARAVAYAESKIGDPYEWGGNGPYAFDCSGLTSQAWAHAGVAIPRTADEQYKGLPRVSLRALRPGDIVAFGYSAGYADHVAIVSKVVRGVVYIIDTSSHRPRSAVGEQTLASRWGGGAWHPLGAVRPATAALTASVSPSSARPVTNAPATTSGVSPRSSSRNVGVPKLTGSAQQIAAAIFGSQYSCAAAIITRESGWSVTATNPSSGAYGLPQALPASKMAAAGPDWRTDPATQLRWMLSYVNSTYGGACNAWAHWQSAGSY